MKKGIALFLSAALVMTSFVQVAFADEQIDSDLQKAINSAKAIIDVPDDYTKFDYSVNGINGEKSWRLSWRTEEDSKVTGEVSVTIDDTGFISGYNQYSSEKDPSSGSKLPKYSRQSAEDTAKAFIEEVQPGLSSKLEANNDDYKYLGSRNYYFNFHYVQEGVPYYGFNCSVDVDGNTNKVRNYYSNKLTDVTFPSKAGALSEDKIQKAYIDSKSIELKYLQSFDGDNIKIYPAYTLTQAGQRPLDAFTGEPVSESSDIRFTNYDTMADKASMSMGAAPTANNSNLTKQELDAVKKIANVMSKEDAEKKIRAIPEVGLTDNFVTDYFNLYKNNKNKDQYIWSMSFRKDPALAENNKVIDRNYINVSIDAETGSLINLYSGYYGDRTGDSKIQYSEAKSIAEAIAKKYEPEKFKQTELDTGRSTPEKVTDRTIVGNNTPDYSFSFRRVVNGIPCDSDYIQIGVDGKTGKVLNYSLDWYTGEFPALDSSKTISLDEAYKSIFEKTGLKLYYINTAKNSEIPLKYNTASKPEIKLVYGLDNSKPSVVDAFSGQLLDSQGKPFVDKTTKPYTDINGHFSEQAVKVLQEYGVGFDSDKFLPDQEINQYEFLELIMKSLNSYFVQYTPEEKRKDYIYKNLISNGIIKEDEVAPDKILSREQAVVFIVRYMGLQKAAEIEGIYKSDFDDKDSINPKLLGYVCIAKGLNLINGYDNKFMPAASMTRGEAAILLYNSMK